MKNHVKKVSIHFFIFSLLTCLFACSSKPTFKPEVDGAGAKSIKGGVVYSVPPKNPVLKMKLFSLGITKENMVHLGMFFLRLGTPAGEFIDPREQSISLPGSAEPIYPSRVHASTVSKPLIKLAAAPKQAIEFLFAVPKGTHEYPFIKLNWRLHYLQDGKPMTMAETERFDLSQKEEPQEGVGSYDGSLEFPLIGAAEPFPDEWVTPGWMWW